MRTRELLLECKVVLKISSDYALAKELKIPTQRISEYMKGTRAPDNYTLTKMALCLGLEPMTLIAEFEAETEKTEERREFWRDFIQRTTRRAGVFLLAVFCTLSLLAGAGTANPERGFRRCRSFV